MSKYFFSQLMNANFSQRQGASMKLGVNPTNASNAGDEEIGFTSGGATLADFFVAPQNQSSGSRVSRRFSNSDPRSQPSIAKQK